MGKQEKLPGVASQIFLTELFVMVKLIMLHRYNKILKKNNNCPWGPKKMVGWSGQNDQLGNIFTWGGVKPSPCHSQRKLRMS